MIRPLFVAALLSCVSVSLAAPAGTDVSFVACPIYRDTNNGRKSGCWLASDPASGVRFDISSGRLKPQIGREVLVEGVSSDVPNACGGPVLSPVHVSVLQAECPAVMLPAEGFPGRVFHVSPASVLPPADVARTPLQPPFVSRQWVIEFGFQSDFLTYQYSEVILDEAARYASAGHPRRVRVVGFAADRDYVISGRHLSEPAGLARARAQMVTEALQRLGVDPRILKVEWHGNPTALRSSEGPSEPSKRRATIDVEF